MSVKTQSVECQQYNKYYCVASPQFEKVPNRLYQLVFEFLSFVIVSNFFSSPSFFLYCLLMATPSLCAGFLIFAFLFFLS